MKKISLILVAGLSMACLWDTDTIEMEKQQFPSAQELISGKFLRHTPEFYYWRIKDREAKIAQYPDSLSLYDDLAVAYDKLGNSAKAIEIARSQYARNPDRYETLANLGTFYFHQGSLAQGLPLINRAIAVNPDAHFGRERYQALLVEYVLKVQQAQGKRLPLQPNVPNEPFERPHPNFYHFLVEKGAIASKFNTSTIGQPDRGADAAVKGILGMMRFGNHESPILLEALGDLLMQDADYGAARQLAARAYLAASYQTVQGKEIYAKKAKHAIFLQKDQKYRDGMPIEPIEQALKKEMEEAMAFYESITAQEHEWILKKMDVEAEYGKKYYQADAKYDPKAPRKQAVRSKVVEWAVPLDSAVAKAIEGQAPLAKPSPCVNPCNKENTPYLPYMLALLATGTVLWLWKKRISTVA